MSELNAARPSWKPFGAFVLALFVFAATVLAAKALPESVTARFPWARQAVSLGLMAAFALGAMAVSRRPFAEFGFRRPTRAKAHFKLWGMALGASSTALILALGLKGLGRSAAALGLPGLVLWVWVVSSTVEELFCRGWFQTVIAGDEADTTSSRTRATVLWSAGLFGSMHLRLLSSGVDVASVAIIVLSVTALGYVCATARAQTGSLRPAIFAHVMFNVGGTLMGVLYAIGYRIATGHLPTP